MSEDRDSAERQFMQQRDGMVAAIRQVTGSIRRWADEIDRIAQRLEQMDAREVSGTLIGDPKSIDMTEDVLHKLAWMTPNLSAKYLVSRAWRLQQVAEAAAMAASGEATP